MAEQASIVIAATDATGAAFRSVGAKLAGLQSTATDTASRLAGLGATLGGLFAAGGIGAFVQSTINGIDALNDLADATGASIENLSALEDTAVRTGTSLDSAGGALVRLNQQLNAAKPGSETENVLKAIGLSAEELRQQDPAQALETVAKALAQYEDDANKARVVQELFGRSVREVAPLLKDLADRGLGVASVTTEQAKAAEAFNLELAALRKNSTDAARAVASDLLPALTDALQAIREVTASGAFGDAIGGALRTTVQALTVFGANVSFVFQGVGREIGAIGAQIAALARLDIAGFNAISEAVKADGARARAELDALERRILRAPQQVTINGADFSDRSRSRVGTDSRPAIGPIPGTAATKAVEDKAAKYLETLRKQLESTRDLSAAERALAEIRSGELGKVTPRQEAAILAIAREVDATKEAQRVAKERADFRREEARAIAEYEDAQRQELARTAQERKRTLDTLLGNTATGRANALRAQLELLNEEIANADPSKFVQFQEAIKGVQAELDALNGPVKETFDAMSAFADQAARNIQDAFGETLEQILSGSFDNIGRLWLNLIQKMLAQAAAARLNEALFGKDGKGGIDLAGLLGSFFGGSSGSGSTWGGEGFSPRGGAATGTNMLARDMVTLVHKGEAIVPAKYNPALGGSRVTINNYAAADVQTRERDDGGIDIDILARVVEDRIAGNVARSRGPLSSSLKASGLDRSRTLARMG